MFDSQRKKMLHSLPSLLEQCCFYLSSGEHLFLDTVVQMTNDKIESPFPMVLVLIIV